VEPDVAPRPAPAPELAPADLDALADQVAALVPAGRGPLAATFARAAVRHLDGLPSAPAPRLAQAFAFLERRSSGILAVRAFNPDPGGHGYSADGSIVEVCVEDRPFLLSTITEELRARGIAAPVALHPVVGVERGPQGQVLALVRARDAVNRQSLIHLELDVRLDDQALEDLAADLTVVLGDVLRVTGDFARMRARLEDTAYTLRASAGAAYGTEEVDEANALLQWLLDDRMILLGSVVMDAGPEPGVLVPRPGTGLGMLRDAEVAASPPQVPPGRLVAVVRTRRVVTVHRRARVMAVTVRLVDDRGETTGEHRLQGLLTQRAYAEASSTTPVLRRTLRWVLDKEDIVDRSYDERKVRALFDALPRHELFAADPEQLRADLMALLAARQRPDVRVFGRLNAEAGSVIILVAMSRDRYSTHIAREVGALVLERFGATSTDFHLDLDDQGQALLVYDLHVPAATPELLDDAHMEELEQLVARTARGLRDDLVTELRRSRPAVEALRLAHAFLAHAPNGYLANTDAATAALDIDQLSALVQAVGVAGNGRGPDPSTGSWPGSRAPARGPDPSAGPESRTPARALGVRVAFRHAAGDGPGHYRLRVYRTGAAIELSTFLPVLESLGLTVTDQETHVLRPVVHDRYRLPGTADRQRPGPAADLLGRAGVSIQDFGVRADRHLYGSVALDVDRDGPRLADAVLAVLRGQIEADSLNRLVLTAGLRWDDVEVLRAYRHYRRQVGTTFTPGFHDEALVANPKVAARLVRLFSARFDPDQDDPEGATASARAEVAAALAAVDNFDEDRILRGILGLIDATLRTNRYAGTRRDCLSLKFDSTRVPDMPKPTPAVEVFVVGPRVQGIHLRGGAVARGGLRWSDRREDFRTEVLGLMKAQMTKNAVIVPTGAKGGFVLTRTGLDPLAQRDEVRGAYEIFVRGLLDLTDNVVDGKVVTPGGVRAHDGEDPYLVVAADRGTATFSDLANQIAAEYGFWLGDAFASGGSRGYDHKAMGITARGAWHAVRRHFRELEVDVQTDPITMVGIGDMSGDVFGNGLLQSRAVLLRAAFDHRHVFLDPNPDAEVAYAERERLFRLPTSSWRDYDRARISPGGGVWSRTQREIPLSDEVRAFLRTDARALPPPELIRLILRAPVDLLWAGGIGTFVRATSETDVDAGDRANDAIRVTADELGARVVGEGGNLAMTQRARIQYARRGGRCNTDAIDNAGGVDTSDREVNLKILLRDAIDQGELTEPDRDTLLASVTDEVAEAVVRDVDLQCAAISRELPSSPSLLEAYESLMTELVDSGRLDRHVELLPDTAEMDRRREAGAGLARPELAVLLGYAKVDHVTRLLRSDLPDEPWLRNVLERYFPGPVVARFPHLLEGHRLRRELVATLVANDLVNHMGITYVSRTARELGCMAWEVAAAWWAASEVVGAGGRWREIEALAERTTPGLQLELAEEVDRVVDTLTRSYLRQRIGAGVGAIVERDQPAFAVLADAAADAMPPARRADRALRLRRWLDLGIDAGLGGDLAVLRELSVVPDVALIAEATGRGVRDVGEVFWRLSEGLPLDDLHARLGQVPSQGSWQYWQKRGLADELRELRAVVATRILQAGTGEAGAEVAAFLAGHEAARERARVLIAALDREGDRSLDGLAVVIRALWALNGDGGRGGRRGADAPTAAWPRSAAPPPGPAV